jgi:hypothetical protein
MELMHPRLEMLAACAVQRWLAYHAVAWFDYDFERATNRRC